MVGSDTALVSLTVIGESYSSCTMSCCLPRRETDCTLNVAVVPSVSISTTTTAVQGNSLTLDCNAVGQPSPTVVWFRDDVQLTSNSRVNIDTEDRIVFSPVFSRDAGRYRCVATSSAGTASATTTLTVLGISLIGLLYKLTLCLFYNLSLLLNSS